MKASRIHTLAIGLITVVATGCASLSPAIQGSGVAKTETRDVGTFREIVVSHAIQLTVTVGSAPSLEITTDDNLLPVVITEVKGDRLRLAMETSTNSSLGVKVKVTTPSLTLLKGSGATALTATGVSADGFQLTLSGASTCQLSGKAERMDATLSGASQCTLSGNAETLHLNCSGSSQVTATDLPAVTVHVDASGASTIDVRVSGELWAKASGASTVRYTGSPAKVHRDESGAGTISGK